MTIDARVDRSDKSICLLMTLVFRFLPVPAPDSMSPRSKNYPHQTNQQSSDAERNYENYDVLKQTEVA
jgi:hypothetical protein